MPARQSRQPEEEKPPPQRMKRYWKVAVLANIKDEAQPKPDGVPPDAFADYDHIETIDALRAAIETDGHKTAFIPADRNLPFSLKEVQPDICFNIAEGLGGDAREAQVPALLEMLGIPYTGSRVLTTIPSVHAIEHDVWSFGIFSILTIQTRQEPSMPRPGW